MNRFLPILAVCLFIRASAWAADTPGAGAGFADCDGCPEMLVVPAGAFAMGANSRHGNERPVHDVAFAKPFAMSRFEITFDNYRACVDDGGCAIMPDDHKWGRGARPVINVTWEDARNYAAWLSKKTGHVYRLPSEAEWEYAARAGTKTAYFWGDEPGENLANCRDCGSRWSKRRTSPVGSFKPNPWGFHDMHGNVWEWTRDCWNETHDGAPGNGAARETGDCRRRVIRSGSWYYFSKNMRSAWRFKNDGRVKSYGIGIRVVREIP